MNICLNTLLHTTTYLDV